MKYLIISAMYVCVSVAWSVADIVKCLVGGGCEWLVSELVH